MAWRNRGGVPRCPEGLVVSDSYADLLAQTFGPNPAKAPPKVPTETKPAVAIDKPTESLEEALVAAITDAVRRVLRERGLS